MNPRLSGALRVLAALDGEPVPRKPVEPRAVRQRLCRLGCGRQITLAFLPTGAWCALDAEPDGDMVIVGATVRARGDVHADAPAYCFHRCKDPK